MGGPASACAARERIIGWYHTGPRLREADLDIHQLLCNYVDNPILVISEVQVCWLQLKCISLGPASQLHF